MHDEIIKNILLITINIVQNYFIKMFDPYFNTNCDTQNRINNLYKI